LERDDFETSSRSSFLSSLISEQCLAVCREKAGNGYFRMVR
jgi:hypothetical protein